MKKTCSLPGCNNEFDAVRYMKYCSDECAKNGHKLKAYKRKSNEKKIKTCPLCDVEFESNTSKRYCSDQCVRDAKNKRRRELNFLRDYDISNSSKGYRVVECALYGCNNTFEVKNNRIYCSTKCWNIIRNHRRRISMLKECENPSCAIVFISNGHQLYHNRECGLSSHINKHSILGKEKRAKKFEEKMKRFKEWADQDPKGYVFLLKMIKEERRIIKCEKRKVWRSNNPEKMAIYRKQTAIRSLEYYYQQKMAIDHFNDMMFLSELNNKEDT